ncbi:MAG: helix-turn-helix transcriptional regulator [Ruminococcaceae bacterium]|nr:helix-turn-helix transcriptional regulator [Oscillospiraceae bacterium]
MDKKTMGAFISALRKSKGMTQQDVADILNVSNKTVSKWERDEGCPEIMMLPAIAELFEVTVDELLKGEKINSETPFDSSKTEKRAKYLFEKSEIKYTNYSVAAVILAGVAALFACLAGHLSYNPAIAVCVISVILGASGIAVEAIAYNSFFSGIKSSSVEIDSQSLDGARKSAALFLSLVISLAVTVILCITAAFISYYFTFIALVLGAISFAIIYYIICQKLKIAHSELSPEFRKYRKKHIKITVVAVAVSAVISLCIPFLNAISAVTSESSFCFLDGVGYQYDSERAAKEDYRKLKDYFAGTKTLYTVIDEFPDGDGYTVVLDEIDLHITQDEKGYRVTDNINIEATVMFDGEYNEIYFDTEEEARQYIYENTVDCEHLLEYYRKNIRFDDETYTVHAASNTDYFTAVGDVMPAFILVACGVAIGEIVISMIVYFVKKKKDKAGQ